MCLYTYTVPLWGEMLRVYPILGALKLRTLISVHILLNRKILKRRSANLFICLVPSLCQISKNNTAALILFQEADLADEAGALPNQISESHGDDSRQGRDVKKIR